MADYEIVPELSRYTGFGPDDHALLAEVGPVLEPRFGEIVRCFYDAILANPAARSVFADDEQIARQQGFLRHWMVGIFSGVYDREYYELRARIGRAHVRIQLDQRYMISGMNVVRQGLHEAADELLPGQGYPAEKVFRVHRAPDKICDLELAIMLETYREDYDYRLRNAEKLATLGQLAATIGHELRNPLAVMETSLHLLGTRVAQDPKARRHIERLGQQVTLCSSIIQDLLEMARDRPAERRPVDIASLVDYAIADLEGSRDVRVIFDLEGSTTVLVDASQIRQLILNLVTNAIQAARTGPRGVTVELVARGRDLVLRVLDDGAGIAPEVMPRLFEPLFTTRTRGVGLGLSLCRRVCEKHGGTIRAGNRPTGGAVFEARLPGAVKEME